MSNDSKRRYEIARGIGRGGGAEPFLVLHNLPKNVRPLRIYALDPSLPQREGAVATALVPFESLNPGPVGRLFKVCMRAAPASTTFLPADLDDHQVLIENGYEPDPANCRFHGQMVYSVAMITYETFRMALGRHLVWADGDLESTEGPLTLLPFGLGEANAYYSREERAVRFGYFSPGEWRRGFPPEAQVFTSLSTDVITHEVTHALLDGLRSAFSDPVSHNVPAFHEAFADLMAVFQRFTFPEAVRAQVAQAGGDLSKPSLLGMLAPELGRAANVGNALRTFEPIVENASSLDPESGDVPVSVKPLSDDLTEPHDRGSVLTDAVFEAFVNIVRHRTRPVIRLATGGADTLGSGPLSTDLLEELVRITCKVSAQIRTMCIRAIDWCPPVDIDFGDYLRALITADRSLVSDDRLHYREAIISAFRRRKIFPLNLPILSESALTWGGPETDLPAMDALALTNLAFRGDPGIPEGPSEIERQARLLAEAVTGSAKFMSEAGLVESSGTGSSDSEYKVPVVSSIRPARRVGPNGQIAFHLISEIMQTRVVTLPDGAKYEFKGGATIITDAWGRVEYIVRKRIDNEDRLREQLKFVRAHTGKFFRMMDDGYIRPMADPFRHLCFRAPPKSA